jgi:glyoxylate/hydroxypyruvate reductase A
MPSPILVCAHLDDRARSLIRETLRHEPVYFLDRSQLGQADHRKLMEEIGIVFGNLPSALIAQCRQLRWMQLESVGFEYYNQLPEVCPGLVISNLKGMFERPATETALAGLLALGRGFTRLLPAQAQTRWIETEVRPETWLLHGRRALVLGAGSIGRRVRLLLEAFGCEVQVFARRSNGSTLYTPAELDAAFRRNEVVVCCLPKTPATIGLVSRARLESMSRDALFVNIGRGAVVDEAALIDVLQRRQIRGAVIDVTVAEPIPPDHPLWQCPNTILTQHTGGGYDDELLDKARCFLANFKRFRAGEDVLNIVDLQQGY